METRLPKVLVVGINAWREDASSHTLKNIFSCWDPERLAHIYTRSELPDTTVASRFFQISETEVLKSVFKPWKCVGREVSCNDAPKTDIVMQEQKRYTKAHKRTSALLTLLREFVWMLGHWRGKKLTQFVSDYNPDLLFIPIYPVVYMGWLQRLVIKLTKKPFVCYLADDNYSYESCSGVLQYVHRFWLRRNVKWLSTHCKDMFVIVEKEKEETDALFDTDSKILTKGIDFSERPYVQKDINYPIKFVYTGSLIIGRDKTMALIADAINKVNAEAGKLNATLDIYSGDEPMSDVMKLLNSGASRHNGFLPRTEVDRVQRDADVVVFAEALEGKESNIARLSFSTKITDYLANGKCVFAVGKESIAPIDYFLRNDSAIVASSDQAIYEMIKFLCDNPESIDVYGRKAYDCAVKNHEKGMIDRRFCETMSNAVER